MPPKKNQPVDWEPFLDGISRGKTVIEYDSEHSQADEYRTLAKKIETNQMFVVPKPLEIDQLEKMLIEFSVYMENFMSSNPKMYANTFLWGSIPIPLILSHK
mgnify:CR=1 FL=1